VRWIAFPFVALVRLLLAAWALLLIAALLAPLAVLALHDAIVRRRSIRAWSPGGRCP
jgi:hypothetical protein